MTACIVPTCGRDDTRPYLNGHRCPDHAPHVPTPPPWTGATARDTTTPTTRTPTRATRPTASAWDTREDSTWLDKL